MAEVDTGQGAGTADVDAAINMLLSNLAAKKVPESGAMSEHTVQIIIAIVKDALALAEAEGTTALTVLLEAHGWTGTQFGSEDQYQTLQSYLRGKRAQSQVPLPKKAKVERTTPAKKTAPTSADSANSAASPGTYAAAATATATATAAHGTDDAFYPEYSDHTVLVTRNPRTLRLPQHRCVSAPRRVCACVCACAGGCACVLVLVRSDSRSVASPPSCAVTALTSWPKGNHL